jgi:hypothetical protein
MGLPQPKHAPHTKPTLADIDIDDAREVEEWEARQFAEGFERVKA